MHCLVLQELHNLEIEELVQMYDIEAVAAINALPRAAILYLYRKHLTRHAQTTIIIQPNTTESTKNGLNLLQ